LDNFFRFIFSVPGLLIWILFMLVAIWQKLGSIDKRLEERFPTEEEEDYQWSQDDPMGHWEAHKDDSKQKK
jgi:hypothetical protein